MKPTDCRFHSPGAVLHHTSRYEQELELFYDEDEEASELYDALVRDAENNGLMVEDNAALGRRSADDSTHRAPVGRSAFNRLRPGTKPVPWIGELTVYGSEAVDDRGPFWRGYYSDLRLPDALTEQIDDVLMASLRAKGGEDGVKTGEQDVHMTQAGDEVRKWCRREKKFTFRTQ